MTADRAQEAETGRVWQVDGKTGKTTLVHCENCRVVMEAIAEEREACAKIVELVLQVKAKPDATSKALVDVLHDAARITAAAIRGRP